MTVRADLLSPRQKDCLRLVYKGLTTKEIARELDIRPGTVATYCAEAKTVLAARNRRHAALLLHEWEAGREPSPPPSETGPHSEGVDPLLPAPPPSRSIRQRASSGGPLAIGNKEADNDLGIATRLAWILALAILIAIGFGALAAGVRTINDLVVTGQRAEQR